MNFLYCNFFYNFYVSISVKYSKIDAREAFGAKSSSNSLSYSKGQLILKYPLGVFKSSKKPLNFFQDFCPSL